MPKDKQPPCRLQVEVQHIPLVPFPQGSARLGGSVLASDPVTRSGGESLDVFGFGALIACHNVENYFLAFVQHLESGAQYAFVVNKNVLPVFLCDETEALFIVPPLYFTTGHSPRSPFSTRLAAGLFQIAGILVGLLFPLLALEVRERF